MNARHEAAAALLVLPARAEGGRDHDRRRSRQRRHRGPLRPVPCRSSPPGCSVGRLGVHPRHVVHLSRTRRSTQRAGSSLRRAGLRDRRCTSTPAAPTRRRRRCQTFYTHPAGAVSDRITRALPRAGDQPDALHRLERLRHAAAGRADQRHPASTPTTTTGPARWVHDRPGMFTGSGMPMRFADADGTMIDVYQAATQMTDESGQTYPFTIDTLLDRALGAEGYYGAFTANMHTDQRRPRRRLGRDHRVGAGARRAGGLGASRCSTGSTAATARRSRRSPRSGNVLTFTHRASAPARTACAAMVPATSGGRALTGLTLNGARSPSRPDDQGRRVRVLRGRRRRLPASYDADMTPPAISARRGRRGRRPPR